MAKLNHVLIALGVFAAVLILGGAYVYCNNCGDYSAEASIGADGKISYSISGPSAQYTYSVFSNTDMPDRIYMYLDTSYKSDLNDGYTQKEYFSVMKQMLERRGYSSVEYADAEKLKDVMTESDVGIFFVSGALPDTVYDGSPGTLFEDWLMSKNGTVYWCGPEMGRYYATKEKVIDLGGTKGFFGGNVNTDEKHLHGYTETGMFRYTQTRYDDCLYGLKSDYPDSKCLAYVSDRGYSTVSAAKVMSCNVFVFGGKLTDTPTVFHVLTNRTFCADLIICGLTYQSAGLDHGTGTISGKTTGTSQIPFGSMDMSIQFTVGSPSTNWAKCIRL